jgi:hypothetical protein
MAAATLLLALLLALAQTRDTAGGAGEATGAWMLGRGPAKPLGCVQALRGGWQRTMRTQPWLIEGLPPEDDPAGKIWKTSSWRERIKRHQAEKSAVKVTERDAYGTVDHVSARVVAVFVELLSPDVA